MREILFMGSAEGIVSPTATANAAVEITLRSQQNNKEGR
jgi:hypothetical protein